MRWQPVSWPGSYRSAVSFSFDLDAESVWLAIDPANAEKPGILSQGRYGPRVGVPLILDLLERRGVTATFFVPGVVAEQHAETVRAIVAAGHKLAVHGYTHDSPMKLSYSEEDDSLQRTRHILEGFGARVSGYRSPAWEFSKNTLGLLEKHGFAYSSNMMDDIRPYQHESSSVVELPVQWILDDGAHFWFDYSAWNKKISTPSEVREIWEAEFRGIHGLGGAFVLTMHPQVIGRPYRLEVLERFIEFVQEHEDAWIAPCGDIASAFRDGAR